MTARWSIRQKLLLGVAVLAIVVAILGMSGFRASYALRDLTITISQRAAEFPDSTELIKAVEELRVAESGSAGDLTSPFNVFSVDSSWRQSDFQSSLAKVQQTLRKYEARLNNELNSGRLLSDRHEELKMTNELEEILKRISRRKEWFDQSDAEPHLLQRDDLRLLREKVYQLPTFLHQRMVNLRDDVRTGYRFLIATTYAMMMLAGVLFISLCIYFRTAVILPFKRLLHGARKVAAGDFSHRLAMNSSDELSELASAINRATDGFVKIQQDLNDQVRQRSNEVIRNEQLASVGFLAAGVAHEINNPLASIAWSAEALESRLHRILRPSKTDNNNTFPEQDLDTLRTYLRRIQDEAFRCKGITERLLDFSRLGQAQRKTVVDVTTLASDVIDMVRHLGQYRNRKIELRAESEQLAYVSPQELKQVILNLLTNALDALGEQQTDGRVIVSIDTTEDHLRLTIEDNGCGMTDEVRQHLFEPFFTRRRDGRGTGLGLPITSRIIADHGGSITPHSDGVGRGSRFEVLLPRSENSESYERTYQAA